jgi:hypothetical protein
VGQAIDLSSVTLYPKIIGDLSVALIHNNYRKLSVRIDKSRGEKLAPAWRTGDSLRTWPGKL